MPDFYLTFPIDRDHIARYTGKYVAHQFIGGVGALDGIGFTMRFHAARRIDCVARVVVDELLRANHAPTTGPQLRPIRICKDTLHPWLKHLSISSMSSAITAAACA
jgi:hypothetical protein